MSGDIFKGKISEDFYKNTVNDGRYDDIIGMKHHVSKDRPHLAVAEVAAAEPKEVLPTAHQATTIHIPVTEQTAVTEKLLSNGKNQLLSPAL